jgi:hypothetical protein
MEEECDTIKLTPEEMDKLVSSTVDMFSRLGLKAQSATDTPSEPDWNSKGLIPIIKLDASSIISLSDYIEVQAEMASTLKHISQSLSLVRSTLHPDLVASTCDAYERQKEELSSMQSLIEQINNRSLAAEAFIKEELIMSSGRVVGSQDLKVVLHEWCNRNNFSPYMKYLGPIEEKLNARKVYKREGRTCYEWVGIELRRGSSRT